MKLLLRIVTGILIVLVLFALGIFLSGNQYLFKGVWATYLHGETSATIDDARFFDTRMVAAPDLADPWEISENYNQKNLSDTLSSTLEVTETVAFLVIKDDKIAYEEYWNGYGDSSYSNSFSMAKSITAMLVQIAIQQGYIKSWNDKVADYLPEIQGPFRGELTLLHLATMSAGLQWDENYTGAFGITAKAYYGPDIEQLLYDEVAVVKKPGENYEYQSGAFQYLGLVLSKATGKTVSEYASEVLWEPMGATNNAYWHLDSKNGMEHTYCCFNSNARDFARFGKLLLHYGNWNGTQILDSTFVALSTAPAVADHYGLSFWLDDSHLTQVFYMRGILGQYIIVIPEKDLVICRLGHKRLESIDHHPVDFHIITEEVIKYFGT